MNISFTFKNFEPSEHLRKYAQRRFEKLARFVHKSDNLEITVKLSVDKFRHKAEVQFVGDNMNFSAVESSEDMYSTVDMVLDKLEAQIKKYREKLKEKRQQGPAKDFSMEPPAPPPARPEGTPNKPAIEREEFWAKPLFPEDAAMEVVQEESGFIIFLNANDDRINILYRRKNGTFGLIDPYD